MEFVLIGALIIGVWLMSRGSKKKKAQATHVRVQRVRIHQVNTHPHVSKQPTFAQRFKWGSITLAIVVIYYAIALPIWVGVRNDLASFYSNSIFGDAEFGINLGLAFTPIFPAMIVALVANAVVVPKEVMDERKARGDNTIIGITGLAALAVAGLHGYAMITVIV